ncbi:nicotinamide mononucleotide transporter [Pseudomonas sp. PDM23]|uniref:nicotinamide riboside transporter PnuC n=1 Tax=unclassified Pseudomonas TaxID=196821 RepID=UPI001783D060|nr:MULTISPECIES: nicotinamide riboside transporter PnuC [unclassified Pseudomonas]MBD9579177.1 nicotinamide mononucleotide transporter [Pseudomonas sp. PDM23]MBD9672837.1 nicotinamide mononucleotide transporter [Pseudomonas sp. PDM21]
MSALEIIAVIVNVLGVWLTARRIRWCWPVNVVAVLLYAWIFFSVKLYSDMLLQLVFVVLQFYGWWQWSRGDNEHGKVRVQRLPPNTAFSSCLAGAVSALALGWAMHTYTDAALPWLDATLTAFSLVASFWAARRYVGSWWLWIILDLVYSGLFLYKALYLTAGLYAGFVVLAIYGLLAWQRELRDEPPALAAGNA